MNEAIERFIIGLGDIEWFANLGLPSSADAEVIRITDWSQWTGPETPGATLYNECTQRWRDESIGGAVELERLASVEEAARAATYRSASARVDYIVGEDPWYGPNAAVDGAAWLAGVIAVRLARGEHVAPYPLLDRCWSWYLRGHWPHAFDWAEHCALELAMARGLLQRKLVVL